jgi:Acyl-protein synthetase, LuxE
LQKKVDFVTRFKQQIFSTNSTNFDERALSLFHYQAHQNYVYKTYLNHLKIKISDVDTVEKIPFLPIEFFKTHYIVSGNPSIETVFESSGTTGQIPSKHYVADINFYREVSEVIFENKFGSVKKLAFIGLLPSYLERKNASLACMVDFFINKSNYVESGFYLNQYQDLVENIKSLQQKEAEIILFGVTFALLDLAEFKSNDNHLLSKFQIIETGGMKGRKKEMIRAEVHQILQQSFPNSKIGSEYGMTELLSQAYVEEGDWFSSPNWMKIIIRNTNDPFEKGEHLNRGGMNVIDLANVQSCAFIETKDLGKTDKNGHFQVLGRFDNSEIRGCNLMVF